MAISNYLENKLIDHLLRATSYAAPATLYIALFTSSLDDAGAGAEVSGGGYARKAVTSSTSAWNSTQGGTSGASSGTGGLSDNASSIDFVVSSASWGTITNIGLYDALTGGNLLFHGALTSSQIVSSGEVFKLAIGDLDITIS